jgi:NTP pyrophosphatase (non-canonical NTP hydrolase)
MDLTHAKNFLEQFGKERGWEKYKTPKNLSMALSVEAAELLEIFQWMSEEQSIALKDNEQLLQAAKEEIADIFCYVLQISSALNIDLEEAFWEKLKKVEKKYPVPS